MKPYDDPNLNQGGMVASTARFFDRIDPQPILAKESGAGCASPIMRIFRSNGTIIEKRVPYRPSRGLL